MRTASCRFASQIGSWGVGRVACAPMVWACGARVRDIEERLSTAAQFLDDFMTSLTGGFF